MNFTKLSIVLKCSGFLSFFHNPIKLVFKNKCTAIKHKTAGLIIIGNEILKAQVKDTNSHFLCKHLYQCGVKVEKISVISDNVDEIAQEIKEFSQRYNHVITSGGIGPTHDDVTYEGLAKAFNDELHCDPAFADIIKQSFKVQSASSPAFKLAHIPKKAILKFGINSRTSQPLNFPCVILKNVYVFPGSPIFLETSFGSIYKELFDSKTYFAKSELQLDAREDLYADALTYVSEEFPHVIFGSYPEEGTNVYETRVTIESDSEEQTKQAVQRFCKLLPADINVRQIE